MSWTALVPLKPPALGKSRLSLCLSPGDRAALSRHLFERTIATLRDVPAIHAIHLLSAEPFFGWTGGWIRDEGRGLNQEIAAARDGLAPTRLLTVHADLPLLAIADVAAMLDRAETLGCAIAADRHGKGTNAVALPPAADFDFAFGPDSLAKHLAQAAAGARIDRRGLALDCDTPRDLDDAVALGFAWPSHAEMAQTPRRLHAARAGG
jgi:2-phospho-L-lactate guanylyltransferase